MTAPRPLPPSFCPERFSLRQPIAAVRGLPCALSDEPMEIALEEDRLTVAFCAPVRRLQQKTQVFPLDIKAATRSRLTHSMELAAYARVLVLGLRGACPDLDLWRSAILTCLHNAALLHDIGNPPFGHFGEELIRAFLGRACREFGSELTAEQVTDLCNFNGNAQGLRIMHSLQELNLTFVQLASVLKVPFTAAELAAQGGHAPEYINAHAGVFLSELPLVERMRTCGCLRTRHCLSVLLELCDDLAYTLADLEDAQDRGLLSSAAAVDELALLLSALPLPGPISAAGMRESLVPALRSLRRELPGLLFSEVRAAVERDPRAFIEGGQLAWEGDPPGRQLLGRLMDYALRHIYRNEDLGSLELSGAHYLEVLLDKYQVLLHCTRGEFLAALDGRGGPGLLRRLARRIPRRHRAAYLRRSRDGDELYWRIRLMVDYISGMTDSFARAEYRLLTGQ